MSPAVFVDASVPIYAAGGESAYKQACARVLTLAADRPEAFVTDAGVLQEILHRYVAAGQSDLGSRVVSSFAQVMEGRIEAVAAADVLEAAEMAEDLPGPGTRVLLHSAVILRVGADRVVSTDTGFDLIPQVTRLDPLDVEVWGGTVLAGDG